MAGILTYVQQNLGLAPGGEWCFRYGSFGPALAVWIPDTYSRCRTSHWHSLRAT